MYACILFHNHILLGCASTNHAVVLPHNLVYLESKTKVKPGRCPTVKPTDTCASNCGNDDDCSGKKKCCEVGCGKTCREPAEEQLGKY